MPKPPSSLKFSLPFNPWIYFFIFLVSNTLLSYFALPFQAKIWIGLLGLLLPGILAFNTYPPRFPRPKPLVTLEFLPELPPWAFPALATLVLFLRFYQLTTLSLWPHFDEGVQNYFSFLISRHWDGRLFFSFDQSQPAYFWISSLLLKITRPSLESLWLMPAILSSLTVPIAYLAARQFFSKSFSFLCVLLMGLSFWPLFIGRFSFITVLLLFWECLALFLWGRCGSAAGTADERKWLSWTGAALGFGFYIHIPHWALVSTWFGGSLLFQYFNRPPPQWKKLWFFTVPFFLLIAPLALDAYREGYGLYLRDLAGIKSNHDLSYRFSIFVSYLSAVFWGPGPGFSAYQSFWGGFLNPLLDSFFF